MGPATLRTANKWTQIIYYFLFCAGLSCKHNVHVVHCVIIHITKPFPKLHTIPFRRMCVMCLWICASVDRYIHVLPIMNSATERVVQQVPELWFSATLNLHLEAEMPCLMHLFLWDHQTDPHRGCGIAV